MDTSIFEKTAMHFVRKRNEFRERVLQACVECGYADLRIREWAHAPSGNANYPTEVRSGETVIAKMWITGLDINPDRIEDDYIIRMFASSDVPEIALRLAAISTDYRQ